MDDLNIRRDRHAGRITLTRPRALNALTHEMAAVNDEAERIHSASAPASESRREAERAAHKSTRAVGAAVSRGRDGADWFTRRPGTASAHGRGLAL